jgi:hypothetical protein
MILVSPPVPWRAFFIKREWCSSAIRHPTEHAEHMHDSNVTFNWFTNMFLDIPDELRFEET